MQVLDDFELVGDLGAAENRDERPVRRPERLAEILDFVGHQEPRRRLVDVVHDAFGRGVRAMRGAERVVHVDVRERRQRFGKRRIVLFLFGVEPQVLEQDDAARIRRDDLSRRRADAVGRERHRPVHERRQVLGHRLQAEFRIRLALRPAEVRREDDRRAAFQRVRDGRQGRANARVVA